MIKEKLTLLIVDDEPRIVSLITQLVDWEELGLECIGTANDGITAKAILLEKRPDILISDIRMPGLDGLALSKFLYDEKIETSVIIISGYKEFEYAHEALKYGVVDFLIKPISKHDLNASLTEVILKRKRTVDREVQKNKIQVKLEESRSRLRKEFVSSCVHGLVVSDDIEEINTNYFFSMQKELFCAIAVRIDNINRCVPSAENYNETVKRDDILYKKLFFRIEEIFLEYFTPKCIDFEIIFENNTLYIAVNIKASMKDSFLRSCESAFESIKACVHIYSGYIPTMGVSSLQRSVHMLKKSFAEAATCITCKVLKGSANVFFADSIITDEDADMCSYSQIKTIKAGFKSFSIEDLVSSYNDLFNSNKVLLEKNAWMIDKFVLTLFLVAEKGALEISYSEYTDLDVWKEYLLSVHSFKKLQISWNEYLNAAYREYFEQIQSRDKMPIRLAKKYIETNFHTQLTLEEIAKSVNLSLGYLCALFKQEVGESVLDYITEVRIENAKSLLESTSMNISEIADAIGYKDAKYFSKLFASKVGLRPKDYRKFNS